MDDDDNGNACNNATRISLTSNWQSMTIMSTPMTDLSAPPLRDEIYVTLEHQALDQTVSQFRGG